VGFVDRIADSLERFVQRQLFAEILSSGENGSVIPRSHYRNQLPFIESPRNGDLSVPEAVGKWMVLARDQQQGDVRLGMEVEQLRLVDEDELWTFLGLFQKCESNLLGEQKGLQGRAKKDFLSPRRIDRSGAMKFNGAAPLIEHEHTAAITDLRYFEDCQKCKGAQGIRSRCFHADFFRSELTRRRRFNPTTHRTRSTGQLANTLDTLPTGFAERRNGKL
jgi:hypothetical protein